MVMIRVNDVSMRFLMANDNITSIKEFVTAFFEKETEVQRVLGAGPCEL